MFYLLNSRFVLDPVLSWRALTGNRYVVGAFLSCIPLQLLFTYSPWMQEIFGSAALSALDWLKVLGAGLLVFSGAELEKWLLRTSGLAQRWQLG